MRDRPRGLSDAEVAEAVGRYWSVDVSEIEYAPVGFGSYHWIVTQTTGSRLFVTADSESSVTGSFADLEAAYATSGALRESGFEFVCAPLRDRAGRFVRRVKPAWCLAVFAYIDGGQASGDGRGWTDSVACSRAAVMVGRLHSSTPPSALRRFDFALRHEATLFEGLDKPWNTGPYAEHVRLALDASRGDVEVLLAEYHRLARRSAESERPWVVSHGEPHSANFVKAPDSSLYLVDWDTVRLAPPERDLAALDIDHPDVLAAYQSAAGAQKPDTETLRLFRLWWDVSEICGFVHHFKAPHGDSADEALRWSDLERYLKVEVNWPALLKAARR